MIERIHQSIGGLIWRTLLVAVVSMAIYVSLSRVLLDLLPQHRDSVMRSVSAQLGVHLDVDTLVGHMDGFTPELELVGLRVSLPESDGNALAVSSIKLSLNPWASLLDLQPRLSSLTVTGAELSFDYSAGEVSTRTVDATTLVGMLRVFREITVTNSTLKVASSGRVVGVYEADLELRRERSNRRFQLRLDGDDGTVLTLSGDGVGDPLVPANFDGEIHGAISSGEFAPLLALAGLDAKSGSGRVGFWYRVDEGPPVITLSADIENLVTTGPEAGPVTFDRALFDAQLRPLDDGWFATVQGLQLQTRDDIFTPGRLQVLLQGKGLEVAAEDIDIGAGAAVLVGSGLVGGRAADIVEALGLSGRVVALESMVVDRQAPLASWSLSAEVQDGGSRPYRAVPGLYGIDTTIVANQDGARSWINTEGFGLDLARSHPGVMPFERVVGTLAARWDADGLYLEDGILSVEADSHAAKVQFAMDIPWRPGTDQGPPLSMMLSVGLGEAPVSIHRTYVPSLLKQPLYQWLGLALPAGDIESGAFIWRGGFSDFGGGGQSMQLGLEVSGLTFAFEPSWLPMENARATFYMDTDRLSAWSDSARMGSLALVGVSAEGDVSVARSALRVAASAAGSSSDALTVLRRSPLAEMAGPVLDDVVSSGQIKGDLALEFDLSRLNQPPGVEVDVELMGVSVESRTLGLTLNDVAGHLGYATDLGFVGRELGASLFGAPVTVQVGRGASGLEGGSLLDARLAAPVAATDATDWLVSLLGMEALSGTLPVTGDSTASWLVDVAVGDSASARISSDMASWVIDLPAPIGKAAGVPAPFVLNLDIGRDSVWQAFWYGRGSGNFYRRDSEFVSATLDLTPRTRPVRLPDPPITDGIYITGFLPRVEVEPWLGVWAQLGSGGSGWLDGPAVTVEELAAAQVVLGGFPVGRVSFDLQPFRGWNMFGINADWIDAELTLGGEEHRSSLIINELDLDALPEREDPEGEVTAFEPPELNGPLTVVVANLRYGDRDLGAVTFDLMSREGSLSASNIRGNLADVALIEGTALDWSTSGSAGYRTAVTLNTSVDDLGRTLRDLGLEPAIETREGTITGALSWPGGPTDIDLVALDGRVDVALQDGSFLPVSAGATGFMRILSVLNLAGLFERANVARLFEPGVTFRRARGQFLFSPGEVAIPNFVVDASGGGFEFDSDIDLVGQTIDGELIVTLPLAENIPWVAALAGGIPVAAGAYLVSKVFKDQVKSLSSGVYSVTGSLDKPEVTFERVFDATSNKVREEEPGEVESGAEGSESQSSGTAVSEVPEPASSSLR